MPRDLTGTVDGRGLRIGIVTARFNAFVTEGLLAGARRRLAEAGVLDDDIVVVRVPGAFEIPLAARALAAPGNVDAVVCLGAVIRGDTPHFEYVSRAVTDGTRQVMLELGVPLGFGVLTTNTVEQAVERSAEGPENKGAEAAATVLEMVSVLRRIKDS